MKQLLLLLVAAGMASLPSLASARQLSIQQSGRANVFGLVEVGAQAPSVNLQQNGAVNMAGIIQAGPSANAAVRQTGVRNSAIVSQFGPVSTHSRFEMP